MPNKKEKLISYLIKGEGPTLDEAKKNLEEKIKNIEPVLNQSLKKRKPVNERYEVGYYIGNNKEKISTVSATTYEEAEKKAREIVDFEITSGVNELVRIELTYNLPIKIVEEGKEKGRGSPAGITRRSPIRAGYYSPKKINFF